MTDYTYSTGNPIGSTDVRDGVDNLKSFDVLLNSADDTYQDRLGNTVPTAAGAINRLGPVVVEWTFTTGGQLSNPSQAALYPANGNYYSWTGAHPHDVAPGTDPTAVTGYVPRTDALLRGELAEPSGVALVGGVQWKTSVTVSEAGTFADAVATGLDVDIDIDVTLSTIVTSAAENQVIRGAGGTLTVQTATGRYRQIHAGAQVHGVDIETTGGLYAITNEAADTLAYNCKFSGNVGHYVLSVDAPRAGVLMCRTLDGSHTTPFVFQGCDDFKAVMNELINHRGFGIQARWCNGGNMSLNTVRNPLYRYSVPAVNGQSVYTFTVPLGGHVRWGFYIQDANGCTARLVSSVVVSGTTATVTISETSVAAAGGDIAVLVGCDALESYQINSGCKNVRIENNFSDGTGDSNIVVGADYRWDGSNWILDHTNVTATDFPYNSVISDNTVKNALYTNITANNSMESISIYNNHCYYAGFSKDPNQVLDCNINCSANGSVVGNDCHSDISVIKTRAGIASIPLAMTSYTVGGERVILSANKFYGWFAQGQYQFAPTSISNDRRIGVKVDGEYKQYESLLVPILATAWTTRPSNDAHWSFVNSGSGWYRNTVEQIIGTQCAATLGGSYVDCYPTFTKDLSEGGIMRIRVKVKGTGYISVFTDFSGGTLMAESITVSAEANFVTKELYMSVKAFTSIFLRIGSDGSDVMYLQDAEIAFLPLSC